MVWFITAGVFFVGALAAFGWMAIRWRARFDDPSATDRIRLLGWIGGGLATASLLLLVVGIARSNSIASIPSPSGGGSAVSGSLKSLALGNEIRTIYPRRSTSEIPRNASLVVVLNNPVDRASLFSGDRVRPESFALKDRDSGVAVSVVATLSSDRMILVLRPEKMLGSPTRNTHYEAVIGSTLKTERSRPVASPPYVWDFSVGTSEDTTPPTIVGTFPEQGSVEDRNTILQLVFSKPMDPLTVLDGNGVQIEPSTAAGTRQLSDDLMTLEVRGQAACGKNACGTAMLCWPSATALRATVGALRDVSGNALQHAVPIAWKTSDKLATTAPAIVRVVPSLNASGVGVDAPVAVTFSTLMSATSMTPERLVLPTDWVEASVLRSSVASTVQLFHAPFLPDTVPIEPAIHGEVTSISQQCFEPCVGP